MMIAGESDQHKCREIKIRIEQDREYESRVSCDVMIGVNLIVR